MTDFTVSGKPGPGRTVAALSCGFVATALLVALLPSNSTHSSGGGSAVAAGAGVWRAAQCIACHSVYGLGGHIGPDLTNAISRLGADGVAAKVAGGGRIMPAFAFSPEQTANLVAWLSYVDETGVYPLPRHFTPGFGDLR